MNITQAIQQLTDLQEKYPGIDVGFEVADPNNPEPPIGNHFVEIQVRQDTDGFYASFVTRP